jgi:uncharacterized membrane protein YedE/YeeE
MNRPWISLVTAAASGVLFGVGLAIARMIDPEKIWNFLDFAAIPTGGWDPSLAFVMGGGVLVGLVGLRLDRWFGLRQPLVAPAFIKTHRTKIDRQLVAGAVIFGVGWGISGFCPGPSFANLGLVPGDVWLFVVALLAGSWVAGQFLEWSEPGETATASVPAQ